MSVLKDSEYAKEFIDETVWFLDWMMLGEKEKKKSRAIWD